MISFFFVRVKNFESKRKQTLLICKEVTHPILNVNEVDNTSYIPRCWSVCLSVGLSVPLVIPGLLNPNLPGVKIPPNLPGGGVKLPPLFKIRKNGPKGHFCW